jgi:hypothetical protein
MAGDFYNADNVVVGHAMLMLTPWIKGAVEPMPADDTPIFTPDDAAWIDWVSAGATNEGFKVNVETSTTQITIEEQSTPVGETVESKAIGIEAVLAEATMEAMRYSWGGGDITVTAAGVATYGKKVMALSDDIEYYTAVLESRNFNGLARRLYVPKVSLTGSGEVSFRRAADKQMFPVRAASLCKTTDIQVVDLTAVPTGP